MLPDCSCFPGGCEKILHLSLKLLWVYGRITQQTGFDLRKGVSQIFSRDMSAAQEAAHVLQVLRVAPFQFGERLQREIVMEKFKLPDGCDVAAALAPVCRRRDKIIWRSQFDI